MATRRLGTTHEVVRLKTALARVASGAWKLDEGPDDKTERTPWAHLAWEAVWTAVVQGRPVGAVLVHRLKVDGQLHDFVKDGRERLDALARGFEGDGVRVDADGVVPCLDLDTVQALYAVPGKEARLVPLAGLWRTDLYEACRSKVNVDTEASRAVRDARLETLEEVAAGTNEYMLPALTISGCSDAEGWEIARALQRDPRKVWSL